MATVSILFTLLLHLLYTETAAVISESIATFPRNENANNECGTTSYYTDDTNRLISSGEETLPGQWPWVVAVTILMQNESMKKFICGGNLLTSKHVITSKKDLKKNSILLIFSVY